MNIDTLHLKYPTYTKQGPMHRDQEAIEPQMAPQNSTEFNVQSCVSFLMLAIKESGEDQSDILKSRPCNYDALNNIVLKTSLFAFNKTSYVILSFQL